MISTFRIKNYRSIVEVTLDFRFAEGKAPNRYKELDLLPFIETGGKTRLAPCLALFGANASGKTNIIRAIRACQLAATDKAIDHYEPNKLHYGAKSTKFELTFHLNGNMFSYSIDYNENEICFEELTKNGHILYSAKESKGTFSDSVITKLYNSPKLQSIIDVECSDGKGHQIISFFSRIGKQYQGLNRDILDAYNYIDAGLLIFPNNNIALPESLDNLKRKFNGDRDKALDAIVELVRKLDIDIKKIEVKQESVDNLKDQTYFRRLPEKGKYEIFNIWSYHTDERGDLVPFNFLAEESLGTHRLAGLVGMMLFCLKGGHTLFIDEIDCSLHSLLFCELIRLFKDKRYNSNKAQLVFTTHNTDILDDSILRLSEVAIMRKSLQVGTIIKRLVEFSKEGQDIRNVTNFRKQYLQGFYSGIPHPAV